MIPPPSWLIDREQSAEAANVVVFTRATDALCNSIGGTKRKVEPCSSNYDFVQRYGLRIDGKLFDFDRYKHLVDVYQDPARFLVLMAGAQTGKSALVFVHILRQMILHWGAKFGYYLPTIDMASKFSATRFTPFVRSQPDFAELIGSNTAKGKGIDNVLTRSVGESVLFFLTTFGKTSTEGLPLHGAWFDEVRRMLRGDIERAMERYSAQEAPTDVKCSTALIPNKDIHRFFLDGDQRFFHTACDCPSGIVLSTSFPGCVLDLRQATPQLIRSVEHAYSHAGRPFLGMAPDELGRYPHAAFWCPRCGKIITDPQDGWWEPHNPGAWVHSYQMPQLLSPGFSAGRLLYRYEGAQDIQEFHNSSLGLPFLDEEKRPINEDQLWACVNTEIRWPALQSERWRRAHVRNTAIGVDVQAGYLCVVIKQRAENGKHRTIHLQVLKDGGSENSSMWRALAELIIGWDADVTVIDNAPEWTEADRIARALPGRVWLATYDTSGSQTTPIAVWGDSQSVDKKQKAKETKFRHTVRLNRVKALRWSLGLWKHRKCPASASSGCRC